MIGKLYRITDNVTGETKYQREYEKAIWAKESMINKAAEYERERYSITIYEVYLDVVTGEGYEEEYLTFKGKI